TCSSAHNNPISRALGVSPPVRTSTGGLTPRRSPLPFKRILARRANISAKATSAPENLRENSRPSFRQRVFAFIYYNGRINAWAKGGAGRERSRSGPGFGCGSVRGEGARKAGIRGTPAFVPGIYLTSSWFTLTF